MDKTITLRVPATLDGARDASSSLRTFLDQFMLWPRAASRFELAVAEALNNVAEHSGSEPGGIEPPISHSVARETLWQFLASMNLLFGGSYILWRWTALNANALWFAIPLAIAETRSFLGLALFTFNLWRVDDTPMKPAPATSADCGAGSIHRRDAVMEAAVKVYGAQIHAKVNPLVSVLDDSESREDLRQAMGRELAGEIELTPYKFHDSEDIYTSIVLQSDRERQWKSVFHPAVESKMLSPQDLQTWIVQQFKYAGGTLDVMFHDNPLLRRGSGMSISQKILYAATFWSYFGGIWNLIFLLAPIVFFLTSIPPVTSYSSTFLIHILPFLLANELAFLVGTWGVSNARGKASYISFFLVNLRALWTVLRGKQIKFPITPKQRQSGRFGRLVIPPLTVMALTLSGGGGRRGVPESPLRCS